MQENEKKLSQKVGQMNRLCVYNNTNVLHTTTLTVRHKTKFYISYEYLNSFECVPYIHAFIKGKGKGKAIPLQAWTGPEGSRRMRFPDFKTIGT